MNVDVSPEFFQNHAQSEHTTPQARSNSNLEKIRKKEAETIIKGDIFTYSGVSFKPMTQEELANEKIDMKSLNLKTITTSKNTTDDRLIIAFRDSSDHNHPQKVIAYKLNKKVVDELKKAFPSDNFFQREDGILRLNNQAEVYIAGWVQDIKVNRGYEKADKNGNGLIDKKEQGDLNIGFDHHTDYDYLGEKIVTAHTAVGAKTYEKYSHTGDSLEPKYRNVMSNQSLNFGNTIEKELSHTLELDKDKDGTITLKEGLVDLTPKNTSVEEFLVKKVKWDHDEWVKDKNIVLDNQKIKTREIFTQKVSTQDLTRRFSVTGTNGEYIDNMNMEEMKAFLGEDYAKNSTVDLETLIKRVGIFHVNFNERQKKIPHETREIKPTMLTSMTVTDAIKFDKLQPKNLDIMV